MQAHARTWATAVIALSLLGPARAADDMSALVEALRAEPLSLFDWGLYQLDRELQSVRRHDRDFVRTLYRASDRLIIVDATFFVFPEEIEAVTAQRACYTRHHAIKLTLGIIDTDRVHVAPAAAYRLGLKFSHLDPEELPDAPDAETIGKELMEAVEIKVTIASAPEEFPFNTDMRCNGRLMSQDVFYDRGGGGGSPRH